MPLIAAPVEKPLPHEFEAFDSELLCPLFWLFETDSGLKPQFVS